MTVPSTTVFERASGILGVLRDGTASFLSTVEIAHRLGDEVGRVRYALDWLAQEGDVVRVDPSVVARLNYSDRRCTYWKIGGQS